MIRGPSPSPAQIQIIWQDNLPPFDRMGEGACDTAPQLNYNIPSKYRKYELIWKKTKIQANLLNPTPFRNTPHTNNHAHTHTAKIKLKKKGALQKVPLSVTGPNSQDKILTV